MTTSLLICRKTKSLNSLKSIIKRIAGEVVVATDSIELVEIARGIDRISKVLFLEKIESLYTVSDKVVTLLNEINLWLAEIANKKGLPSEIMFWPAHCEGGGSTQRIQDGLLLLNSYITIIQEVNPSEIIILKEQGYSFEETILTHCADHLGVGWRMINSRSITLNIVDLRTRLYPLLKEIYTVTLVVFYKIMYQYPLKRGEGKKNVVIQVCGSASNKVINHTVPLIKSLNKVGFEGIALCWGTGRSINTLRKNNITTIPLEKYVTWQMLLESWYFAILAWKFSKTKRDSFLSGESCEYLVLRHALWQTMKDYLIGDVPRRYRLFSAASIYWRKNPACASRLWTRVMPEGVIAYRAIPKDRPIFQFWQPGWPYQLYWPYKARDIPVDYTFALSSAHITQLINDENIPPDTVTVVGMPWMKFIKDFSIANTKLASRQALNIPLDAKRYIFIDAFDSIRGYLSVAEQAFIMNCVIKLIINNPDVYFIVKARPSPQKGSFELFFSNNQQPNLIVLPREDLPYHALNSADLIITKFSTLTVEGMILKVPSVGVILDGEKHFAFSENAMHYSYSIEDFILLIQGLISDIERFNTWREAILTNSENFLRKHLYIDAEDPNVLIAKKLATLLLCE